MNTTGVYDWINLAQGRDQQWALVNTVKKSDTSNAVKITI